MASEASSYQQIVTGYGIAFSLHEAHSNQGLVSELVCQVDIYEEAIREERTRIARELDTLVQTFLSASMQLAVTAGPPAFRFTGQTTIESDSSGNGRRDKRGPEHDSRPALVILTV